MNTRVDEGGNLVPTLYPEALEENTTPRMPPFTTELPGKPGFGDRTFKEIKLKRGH